MSLITEYEKWTKLTTMFVQTFLDNARKVCCSSGKTKYFLLSQGNPAIAKMALADLILFPFFIVLLVIQKCLIIIFAFHA